ncbi:hypothetical protein A9264_00475 [Vibrio sp. UCD-FRSSP16_10]|uniref:hypothetical protein n=1 Tax=unclassified Vibrio TaxID=2614977 RepID=UPI0007FE274A|nr:MULTISPECIES: hypothetical protein [unclassified Vibrio]OBT17290.1 hypothetical protein A9260_01925 [Vibrio sp. UCD-FRSSP16_30]OBT23059.1 hypothetical protein A9264_00475 [Vibrio sp. UCD-FRSSP16_10]
MQSKQSVLAKNIKKRMNDLNIQSNLALAKDSGVSRAVITNIMQHPEKSIMADSAFLLGRTLQCTMEWLLTGKGPITPTGHLDRDKRYGAPLFSINDISDKGIDLLFSEASKNEAITRFMCPTGNKPSIFTVWQSRPVGRLNHAGHIYFDKDKKPVSGQLVIVRTHPGAPLEYMEFYSAYDKNFVRYIEEHIPEDLRMIELQDHMQIIATFECFVVT